MKIFRLLMRILDLFSGLGGELRRPHIQRRGHEYITVDIDRDFAPTITADVRKLDPAHFYGVDFVWASPPCEAFSVASIGHHWRLTDAGFVPQTQLSREASLVVFDTLKLISQINPSRGWLMENPRGILRKLPVVAGVPRVTVTYCKYGESRMKPTDLWGTLKNWIPRPACKNGDNCHERAPRGSRCGTQAIVGPANRAVVPWPLWAEILDVLEGNPQPFSLNQ